MMRWRTCLERRLWWYCCQNEESFFWRRSILLALLLPMAVLAKSTNLTLLPVAAAALLIGVWRREIRPLQALGATLFVLGLGGAMTWSYFSSNLHNFGTLTTMQEAIMNHEANRPLIEVLTAMPIRLWQRTTTAMWATEGLWTGGWSFLRTPKICMGFYEVILVLSAALFLARSLDSPWEGSPSDRSFAIADDGVAVSLRRVRPDVSRRRVLHAWSGKIATNPWYAAPAIPWWLIVLCAGASTVRKRWAQLALLWAMPILCFGVELYGLLAKMIPFYSATSLGEEALSRLATLHPAGMGNGRGAGCDDCCDRSDNWVDPNGDIFRNMIKQMRRSIAATRNPSRHRRFLEPSQFF